MPAPPPNIEPKMFGERARVEAALAGTAGETRAAHAKLADRIVFLTILLVAQHVVRFGDVLELLLRFLRLVQVGMVFARQLAVRFGDFGVGGVFGDTEDL